MNSPHNVVFDSTGNMYISDQNENRVRKVDALTGEISTFAGTGASGDSGDGGQAAAARLSSPYALAFHDGGLYIGGFGTVRKVDLSSETIRTVAGNGSCNPGADIGDGGRPYRPTYAGSGALRLTAMAICISRARTMPVFGRLMRRQESSVRWQVRENKAIQRSRRPRRWRP